MREEFAALIKGSTLSASQINFIKKIEESLIKVGYLEFSGLFQEALAADIAEQPGLIWKVWTEDPKRQVVGGVYLFAGASSTEAYIAKHTSHLTSFGITDITATSTTTRHTKYCTGVPQTKSCPNPHANW